VIALLQRVCAASVEISGERVAEIGPGLLVFIGVERGDDAVRAERLLERVLGYRVFEDGRGRMNRSLVDVQGGLLLVPQFTLAADTTKGMRPSFSTAADPEAGERWFRYLAEVAARSHAPVGCGIFGANMKVALVNDGPVTFWLQVAPGPPKDSPV
jgi:D-tyrosyl-tRNA(Tyr) deacylase